MRFWSLFDKERSLQNLTTLGIGGKARFFLEVSQTAMMRQLLLFCKEEKLPYFILGKGSNTLFDDRGFAGVVISNKIQFLEKIAHDKWHVGAGYSFSHLGSQSAREGLSGMEFACGIPGSVGGAIYMNAGANGRETSESLLSVDYLTEEGELLHLDRQELQFAYRFSSFQKKLSGVIIGATFQFTQSEAARQRQLEIISYRKKTQPYDAKSAGCIFKNPPDTSAGLLIEKSGLKGKKVGGAEVSMRHANFLINAKQASSQDFLALIASVREEVERSTGILLESEIRLVPYNPLDTLGETTHHG